MATITGNIATATNTGQLTYNALRRKGGRFYSDARLHDICVDAGQSWEWCDVFVRKNGKWRSTKTKQKKNNEWKVKPKINDGQQFAYNPATEHWLDRTCQFKPSSRSNFPCTLNQRGKKKKDAASVTRSVSNWWYFQSAATSLKLIYCRDYWLLQFHMKDSHLSTESQLHPLGLFNFQTHFQLSINPSPNLSHLLKTAMKEFSLI